MVFALVAGCATPAELRVAPIAFESAAETLRAGQPATLTTIDERTVTVRPDQLVDVITTDQRRLVRRISDVVGECTPASADPDHLCELHGIDAIAVGHRREPSTTGHTLAKVAIIGAGVAAAVGLTYCADVCKSPDNGFAIAGAVVEVAGFLVWAALSSKD